MFHEVIAMKNVNVISEYSFSVLERIEKKPSQYSLKAKSHNPQTLSNT